MSLGLFGILQLVILLNLVKNSMESKYDFLLEDEKIFSACRDQPKETLDITSLFDFTNTNFIMSEEGVTLSGNHSVIWDIQASDRIEVHFSALQFDRGTWQPTTLNMFIKDICEILFDKNQLWYNVYSKHIQNTEEMQNECYVKGTTILLETYTINFELSSAYPIKNGRYALHSLVTPYDKNGVKRPQQVCFEVKGEFLKKK
ncbi:uncharacterized protein LOC108046166 [Drosophila rhopaloa]|uniref:Uncharacterized protein LOC108046166 n=1 Tax=Drosophila rhopaloa TaxID=1041015 RepID=A0A6P4EST1_DRORH|nr:uncharacterized protein LOC108046166 [Drosophila rhopaloa]